MAETQNQNEDELKLYEFRRNTCDRLYDICQELVDDHELQTKMCDLTKEKLVSSLKDECYKQLFDTTMYFSSQDDDLHPCPILCLHTKRPGRGSWFDRYEIKLAFEIFIEDPTVCPVKPLTSPATPATKFPPGQYVQHNINERDSLMIVELFKQLFDLKFFLVTIRDQRTWNESNTYDHDHYLLFRVVDNYLHDKALFARIFLYRSHTDDEDED